MTHRHEERTETEVEETTEETTVTPPTVVEDPEPDTGEDTAELDPTEGDDDGTEA